MKIQSRYRDYYDHIGLRYGQDPAVLYVRKPLTVTGVDIDAGQHFKEFHNAHVSKWQRQHIRFKPKAEYNVKYLVAATHVFPFLTQISKGDGMVFEPRQVTLDEFKKDYDSRDSWTQREYKHLLEPNAGIPDEAIKEVIRAVGAPVFVVIPRHHGKKPYGVGLEKRIPVLSEWGIPSIVTPEQMWQGIYAVVSNVLRDNPDRDPPVEVSNESKIVKAGFDLKTSFRGKTSD